MRGIKFHPWGSTFHFKKNCEFYFSQPCSFVCSCAASPLSAASLLLLRRTQTLALRFRQPFISPVSRVVSAALLLVSFSVFVAFLTSSLFSIGFVRSPDFFFRRQVAAAGLLKLLFSSNIKPSLEIVVYGVALLQI